MTSPFTVRLCSEKVAYEVRLKRKMRVDLPGIAESVASATGMHVKVVLPAILVLESDTNLSVTIFPDGKMILRGISSQDDAEKLATTIADVIPEL